MNDQDVSYIDAELARNADRTKQLVDEAYQRGMRHGAELAYVMPAEHEGRYADDMTVLDARTELHRVLSDGTECPVCRQNAKAYRRALTTVTVRAVAALYVTHGLDYGHLPTIAKNQLPDVAHQGGYLTLGQHWDLIAEDDAERPDGGRAGMWRVTDRGEAFLKGWTTVSYYVHLYNNQRLGHSGRSVGVAQVLDEHFDYTAIMARAPIPADGARQLFSVPVAA